ncbi:hypothetical protein EBU99_09475 [bacterium]|nr:hypothetical protein [bacterium]
MASKEKPLPANAQEHAIQYSLPEEKIAQGFAHLQHFSPAERSTRANSFLLKSIIFGFCGIIVPPHIIYPIAGIIVGFIGQAARKREKYLFLGGSVTCPACSSTEKIPKTNEQFPFLHFCSQCSARGEVSCPTLSDNL